MEGKLSVREAAEILNYHVCHIYRLIALGALHGERFGNYWLLDVEEVAQAKAQQDDFGRWHHGKTAA